LYLARNTPRYLAHLGALAYDPLRSIRGLERAGRLAALALVVDVAGLLPDPLPSVMLAADDDDALRELVAQGDWPEPAVWVTASPAACAVVEQCIGRTHDPARGQVLFVDTGAIALPVVHATLRALSEADADWLDMTPVSLSATALRGWLRRGWRVFGALQGNRLLCHALAAYPVEGYDEVAAVFTAPRMRGQGLAKAVVATVLFDIRRRGRAAFYVAARQNISSQRVALGVGLQPIAETWEVVTTCAAGRGSE
jgi:GNAT superfamily N-acetyltransferase